MLVSVISVQSEVANDVISRLNSQQ